MDTHSFGAIELRQFKAVATCCIFFFFHLAKGQEIRLHETFDNTSQFTIQGGSFFSDGSNDYFGIYNEADPVNSSDFGTGPVPSIQGDYVGFATQGNFLTGQDLDAPEGGLALPVSLIFSNIDISGLEDLQFSALLAEDNSFSIDIPDFIDVFVSIDGGEEDLVLSLRGGAFSDFFREDTDFDGIGDGPQLGTAATTYTRPIPGEGSLLTLRIAISVNGSGEDFAMDDIMIFEEAEEDPCLADVTPPMISCQDLTIQLDASGIANITAADIDDGSSDNCGIASSTIDINSFNCSSVGTPKQVTLTLTDNSSNVSTCQAMVTVEDNTPPEPVCQDITVELDASGSASITAADIDNGSSDNCGAITSELDISSFDCTNLGYPMQVTLTVTDGSDITSECKAQVTVVENTPPVASCKDITVQLDASGNATITAADIDNGSSDNCGIANISVTPSNFTCADVGVNTVQLLVVDNGGNESTCSASVTVEGDLVPAVEMTLWPPNHKYQSVSVSGLIQSIAGSCQGLSENDLQIMEVTSDEPENGSGDGNTLDDMVVTDCQTVDLRSERQGSGNGRVYTIKIGLDNLVVGKMFVYVPKSVNGIAVDDGATYIVDGCGTSGRQVSLTGQDSED